MCGTNNSSYIFWNLHIWTWDGTHFVSHQMAESWGEARVVHYRLVVYFQLMLVLNFTSNKRCSINIPITLRVMTTTRSACLTRCLLHIHLNNIGDKVWQRLVHFNLLCVLLDLVFLGVQFMTYPADLRLHDLQENENTPQLSKQIIWEADTQNHIFAITNFLVPHVFS